MSVDRAVRQARLWKAFYLSALAASRAALFFAAAGLVLLAADWARPMPETARRALWLVSAAAALAVAAKPWRPGGQLGARRLASELGRGLSPADAVLNAWELSRATPPGTSRELAERDVRRVEASMSGVRPSAAVRPDHWSAWTAAGLAAAALALAALLLLPEAARAAFLRVYYPFGAPETIPGLARVLPGDARFPAGQDVDVRVEVSGGRSEKSPTAGTGQRPMWRSSEPELWVRAGKLSWEKRSWDEPFPDYRHRLRRLTEPLSYKVRFRGRWTPVFRLEPVPPLRFESFRFEVRSPAYAGRAVEVVTDSLLVRALRGSRVSFRGRLSGPAAAAALKTADGRSWPAALKGGREVSWIGEAYESLDLEVEAVSPELPGAPQSALSWRLEAEDDLPPRVELLSPAQDLMVGPRETLPLTFRVSDDLGVARAALNYQVNGGPPQETALGDLSGARPKDAVLDHLWTLSLRPGDEVRYHVSAEDNNALGGPGKGTSASFTLRVASYEEEHRELEAELAEFRKALLGALADETVLREDLKAPSPDWNSLASRQAGVRRKTASARAGLESLLRRMERDPLTDQATAAEYEGIRRNLAALEQDALARAEGALAARQAGEAGRAMDEAAAELERLSLLAEDAQQAERMRKLLLGQEDLGAAAESLRDGLASRGEAPLSDAERRRWGAALDEIARLTAEIADQIQRMPQELPEDFVNQPAMKTLRFDEVQSLMEQARRALESGDAAGALAAAQKMLAGLKEIQKALREAGEKTAGGPSWFGGPLAEELERRTAELDALIERQEKLKAVSDAAAKTALDGLLKEQADLLRRLAEEQAAWRAALGRFDEEFAKAVDAQALLEGRFRLARAQELARAAEQEFRRGDLQAAPRGLEEAGAFLGDLRRPLEDARVRLLAAHDPKLSTASARAADLPEPARGRYGALTRLEQERAALQKENDRRRERLASAAPEETYLPADAKETLRRAAPGQAALQADTLSLRKKVLELARKTATIGAGLPRRLALAAEAMAAAAGELERAAPRKAAARQEDALRHLREVREEMSSSAQSAASLGRGGAGRPMAGSIQPMPGGSGAGARAASVRLPKADEYKPPREFREELLRSLREKYPKAYERTIKEYYERFAD